MKRLESNLLNMVLSLTLIALVAAGLLGVVNMFTKEPIEKSKQQKQEQAIKDVLPKMDGIQVQAPDTVNGLVLYRATLNDEFVGVAVETFTKDGFSGEFRLMVGFDAEGQIVDYVILEHQETPGLGAKMDKWFKTDKNHQSVLGINPSKVKFTVSKDGGDVDAITAATISSRAFLGAIDDAYKAAFNEPQTTVIEIETTETSEDAELIESFDDSDNSLTPVNTDDNE